MDILGIDPGTATTGFGVVKQENNIFKYRAHGIISTQKNTNQSARLLEIREDLIKLIKKYKPAYCCIEKLFFHNNTKTAMAVSESRGVILATLEEHGIEIFEISPRELKSNLTGDGGADKKQIQKMVKILLKLEKTPKPDDAADALALALFPIDKFRSL